MPLSFRAQEQVDEKIKELLIAFFSGAGSLDPAGRYGELTYDSFLNFMRQQHRSYFDYIDKEKCWRWLSTRTSQKANGG